MKNKLITYLKKNKITNPEQVDKLLITSFVIINKIKVKKNRLILNSLINKSNNCEYSLLSDLLLIIREGFEHFGFEELIKLFEFVISPSDRIINGAVYTPSYIRDYITRTSLENYKSSKPLTIADISCGCGGFLFTACRILKEKTNKTYSSIFKENIYGIDIQIYSVNRTKLLLTLLALKNNEDREEFEFNVYIGDSLTFKWNTVIDFFNGFDVIIGNPPYVCSRNLSPETKNLLTNWSVCSSGHPDLYIPFFQIGIENLSANGILSYITMNSFFKSLNGRSLRKYFHDNNILLKIYDFGSEQIFSSKNTYTCLCFLKKVNSGYIEYSHINSLSLNSQNISFERISYNLLDHKKGWNLRNNNLMKQIESTGKPFGEIFKTSHGIATLKNKIYIFKPIHHDDRYYYMEKNSKIFRIEKEICRDIINSNKLSSNYSLDELIEKIIFPYTNEPNPQIIPERELKKLYPFAYNYLSYNKLVLSTRDKGNKTYPSWYAYGRKQSLKQIQNKLFLPKITNTSPYSIISSDKNLMFYNGIAIVGHSYRELLLIQKIIGSRLFWHYISKTSKPYSSDYFSLNGNYINNFGIYPFSEADIEYIISEEDQENLNHFIENKYGINIMK
ncbi:class I SAM-dependent DNA methyltransferase [Serratia rubidaea]|uniref:site-specific DNA-methyltransferase (adenine-specific) n=1 Tax=Serratia rubidaea TaxID=61652 RepID=A0A3S4WC94_SERRU|nr:N-6 DNA methylase [Serratia rubidaea]VEI62279.1 Type IIS restriction enzyme Eco57I [Serratia rubidaea]